MSGGGHHHLVALDLTTAPPSLGTPLLQVNVPVRVISTLPPIADIPRCRWDVRKVPKADAGSERVEPHRSHRGGP
jgi:hypothetical protein